jgi:ABC-type uncharacterized transport systems, ATPase components
VERQGGLSVTESAPPTVPLLALKGIVKRFPGCLANDRVDFEVLPGEIHALLGENGAGKSTLVKIIYGVLHPDAGEIRWQGRPSAFPAPISPAGWASAWCSSISRCSRPSPSPRTSRSPSTIRPAPALEARIVEVSEAYGLPLDPDRSVHDLSVGERQRIEIVRCLLQNPKLLIMDEPTSVLTPQEVAKLFTTLRRLAEEGCSILYISHKLEEIKALCDRATIMRMGRVVAECDPRRETAQHLAELMIGTELKRRAMAGAPRKRAPRALPCRACSSPPSSSSAPTSRTSPSPSPAARSWASAASPAMARTSSWPRSPARRWPIAPRPYCSTASRSAGWGRASGARWAPPSCRRSATTMARCAG